MAEEEQPKYQSDDENDDIKGNMEVGQQAIGTFKDFLLKEELLRAIKESGFEKPSEVQNHCIPYALQGNDVLCQAKAGTGKTAVFVLSILNQLSKQNTNPQSVLVICHTRELAIAVKAEFVRLGKFLNYRANGFYGGTKIDDNKTEIKNNNPHIVVGTPGRIWDLTKRGFLNWQNLKHFVVDECDYILTNNDMRKDVQEIFFKTPQEKQVMMFSGTMPESAKTIARKFMHDQYEIIVEDNSKLVLHGLDQYYKQVKESDKIKILKEILDKFPFNQVIIFTKSPDRAEMLSGVLNQMNLSSIFTHGRMEQPKRESVYSDFKQYFKRILVATDLMGRGIDIERVNLVINFDMPEEKDNSKLTVESYMHRVGRAGRFETKGMAVSFVSDVREIQLIEKINEDFAIGIKELPKEIDTTNY